MEALAPRSFGFAPEPEPVPVPVPDSSSSSPEVTASRDASAEREASWQRQGSFPGERSAPPEAAPAPEASAPRREASSGVDVVARKPSLLEQLVRDPAGFVASIEGRDVAERVRALLVLVAVGAGVFGAVVGTYRGGRQIAYCGAKVPLLLIGTLVLCAPAFIAIARATGVAISARGVIALTLGASARFALVLAGLAPVVWLVQGVFDYHSVILVIVAACAVAGCAAGGLLFRGLVGAPRAAGQGGGIPVLAGLAIVSVYAVVGVQTSWLLRPFVVRPRTVDVPFVRAIEGDLLDAVGTSLRSSMGRYDRSRAPLPGELDLDIHGDDDLGPLRTRDCEGSRCD